MPALLRRVATTIEELGQVEVYDLVMHNEVTDDGTDWPSITVYFDYSQVDEPEEDEPEGDAPAVT
ncbi:hypothetical protein [Microbispora sp. KK1-11]|uniref:hypothetical protein n=1 Tax=Microbispora sp. KK1-11 TaxID=2053005 RepID=UPI001C8E882B|nr:hypothetical protein [Microbispora sp. KK1-11]